MCGVDDSGKSGGMGRVLKILNGWGFFFLLTGTEKLYQCIIYFTPGAHL